jgi:hypothetical protein
MIKEATLYVMMVESAMTPEHYRSAIEQLGLS